MSLASSGGFRGGQWGRSPLPSRKNFRFFPAKANENEFLPPRTVLKKLFLPIIAPPFQNPRSATETLMYMNISAAIKRSRQWKREQFYEYEERKYIEQIYLMCHMPVSLLGKDKLIFQFSLCFI
jgi:hypothetical protein